MSEEIKPTEPVVPTVDAVVVVVPEPEVVVKQEAVAVAAAAPEAKKGKNSEPSNVAAKGSGVYVQMAALIPMGSARNSRSVISVQKRLMELGYELAGNDKSGYFGENTMLSLRDFQKDKRIESNHCADLETIKSLFSGTAVEILP